MKRFNNLSVRLKHAIELLLALILPITVTVVMAQSQGFEEEPTAEGRLSEYVNQQMALYMGEGPLPVIPGENMPRYPGDENWNGHMYAGYSAGKRVADLATNGYHLYGAIPEGLYQWVGRWNGSQWDRFPAGDVGEVYGSMSAIAAQGDIVVIGGRFTDITGRPFGNIALWNGVRWDAMRGGLTSSTVGQFEPIVYDIAIADGSVYVVGKFDTAGGGVPVSNVARWDIAQEQWYPLGSGLNNIALTVSVSGGKVYVGGIFTQAGGQPASYVARWDGAQWLPLGAGTNNTVHKVLAAGDQVFAGGDFTQADGAPANHIAWWDGSHWWPLGSGLPDKVEALALHPRGLFAGGTFSGRTQQDFYYVAMYDWSGVWKTMGSGVNNDRWYYNEEPAVFDMIALGNQVYVGGSFNKAGNNGSSGLATWHMAPEVQPYQLTYPAVAPGSYIYLIGRYFPPYTQVKVTVDDKPVAQPGIYSDGDGKVYVVLCTRLGMLGPHTVKLSAGNLETSYIFTTALDAPFFDLPYGGYNVGWYEFFAPVVVGE